MSTSQDVDEMMRIEPLSAEHAAACEAIARGLPDWFGMESGLLQMRADLQTDSGLVAMAGDTVHGFLTLRRHYPETWEITWLAVERERRGQGIGRRLIEAAITGCRAAGAGFLLVKTLADTDPSPEYAETRAFYRAMGFAPLTMLPDLWDPENPCLLMGRGI